MKILDQAKKMEAKLDFFNRQAPAAQARLLATGYFNKHSRSDGGSDTRYRQLDINIEHLMPTTPNAPG